MQKLNILSRFRWCFLLTTLKNHICWIKHSFSLVPVSSMHRYLRQPVCCRFPLFLQSCSFLALFHQSLQRPWSPPDHQCWKTGIQQQILLGLRCSEGTDRARRVENKDLPFPRCCEHPWGDGRHRGGWCHPEAVPDVPEAMQRHVRPWHVPLPALGFPAPLPRLPHAEGRGHYLQREVPTAPARLGMGGWFPGLWVPPIPAALLGVEVDVKQNMQKWVYSLLRNS